MKLIGVVELDGIEFDCYGEFDKADPSVGMNAVVYIEDIRHKGNSFIDYIKPEVYQYIEDDLYFQLT